MNLHLIIAWFCCRTSWIFLLWDFCKFRTRCRWNVSGDLFFHPNYIFEYLYDFDRNVWYLFLLYWGNLQIFFTLCKSWSKVAGFLSGPNLKYNFVSHDFRNVPDFLFANCEATAGDFSFRHNASNSSISPQSPTGFLLKYSLCDKWYPAAGTFTRSHSHPRAIGSYEAH